MDSVEGVGSTFSFTIPFGVVQEEERNQSATGIEIRTISVHANANVLSDVVDLSQTHRILVVDGGHYLICLYHLSNKQLTMS